VDRPVCGADGKTYNNRCHALCKEKVKGYLHETLFLCCALSYVVPYATKVRINSDCVPWCLTYDTALHKNYVLRKWILCTFLQPRYRKIIRYIDVTKAGNWDYTEGGSYHYEFAPRGQLWSLGGMFTPSFTPRVNTLYCLEDWTEGLQPWEITSPLGDKVQRLR
jgi:hypothetical protein